MTHPASPATHYRYEFDDTGGYDCMYGAFRVLDPKGKPVLDVDLRHFGQAPCEHPIPKHFIDAAEAVAKTVVDAFNSAKCQYAEDVGMPEHRCAVKCQYIPSATPLATDKITSVSLAFDYIDQGVGHAPWVKVYFPMNDWEARDAFAKAIGRKEQA